MNNNFESGNKSFWTNTSQELWLLSWDIQRILAIQPKIVLLEDTVDLAFWVYRDTQEHLWIDDLIDYYNDKLLNAPIEHVNPTLEKHIEITEMILKNRLSWILESGLDLTDQQRDIFINIQ